MATIQEIPHQGYYVTLRAEYVHLTDSVIAAQLLSLLETWTRGREAEIERVQSYNKTNPQQKKSVPTLWLYEKIEHFQRWLPWIKSEKTIRTGLNLLVEKGLINKRNQQSAHSPWDRTLEYKLNIKTIIESLSAQRDVSPKPLQASPRSANGTATGKPLQEEDSVEVATITECSQESLPDETYSDYHLQAVTVTGCNRESLPDEYNNNQSNNHNNSLSNSGATSVIRNHPGLRSLPQAYAHQENSKPQFFDWRSQLFPEERESWEKFVENKIAELPRKVVLKDEWLIALTAAGTPRWEALRTEWENVEKLKSYARSIVPTGVDDLAKSFVDWLTSLTSPSQVKRNIRSISGGMVYGGYVDDPFPVEVLAGLNLNQIKALLNWKNLDDIDGGNFRQELTI